MDALPLNDGREDSNSRADEPSLSDACAPLPMVVCWRCGKKVPADTTRCPYCQAALTKEAACASEHKPLDQNTRTLTRLIGFFAAILGTSVLAGLIQHVHAATAPKAHFEPDEMLAVVVIFETIDTALILGALAWIGMRHPEPHRSFSRRVLSWAIALPILAVALAFNVFYHHVLSHQFGIAHGPIQFGQGSVLIGWVLVICLQPAVMEELFFRYLMFGSLRSVMGGQAVVWVTAVMFAAAHVGVPFSTPVLFVLGLLLGYARLASGGMYLPIFLHFVHNVAVMALNANHF